MIVAASYVLIVNCNNPACPEQAQVSNCQKWTDSAAALREHGWFVDFRRGAVCGACRRERGWRRKYLPKAGAEAKHP